MRISNNTTPSPKSEVVTHVDGDYLPIPFNEVHTGDTLRIQFPGKLTSTTQPVVVTSHEDLHPHREVLLTPKNVKNAEAVHYRFPTGHGMKIYRLLPALPTEEGSRILIDRYDRQLRSFRRSTLAQLNYGKFNEPFWFFLDTYMNSLAVEPSRITEWRPAYITTTNPND